MGAPDEVVPFTPYALYPLHLVPILLLLGVGDQALKPMDLICSMVLSRCEGMVFSAAEGMGEKSWKMKRGKLSKRSTTSWDELMTVRCLRFESP